MSMGGAQSRLLQLAVVDDYEPCPCHTVLVTRRMDTPRNQRVWVCFSIENPCQAGFGDRVDWDPVAGDVYIVRNEKLTYRLQMGKMPAEHIVLLNQILPYSVIYKETLVLFPNTG